VHLLDLVLLLVPLALLGLDNLVVPLGLAVQVALVDILVAEDDILSNCILMVFAHNFYYQSGMFDNYNCYYS